MQGYQLSFFTQQDKRHAGYPLGEWIIDEACRLGIRGATLFTASEGFGRRHKLHSSQFFELADQPLEVTMAVSAEEAQQLMERLREEHVDLFYIKTPIEFGTVGGTPS